MSLAERKTGAPKQHSDCDFVSHLVILRGRRLGTKEEVHERDDRKFFSFLVVTQSRSVFTKKLSKGSPNDTTRESVLELTVASP